MRLNERLTGSLTFGAQRFNYASPQPPAPGWDASHGCFIFIERRAGIPYFDAYIMTACAGYDARLFIEHAAASATFTSPITRPFASTDDGPRCYKFIPFRLSHAILEMPRSMCYIYALCRSVITQCEIPSTLYGRHFGHQPLDADAYALFLTALGNSAREEL